MKIKKSQSPEKASWFFDQKYGNIPIHRSKPGRVIITIEAQFSALSHAASHVMLSMCNIYSLILFCPFPEIVQESTNGKKKLKKTTAIDNSIPMKRNIRQCVLAMHK